MSDEALQAIEDPSRWAAVFEPDVQTMLRLTDALCGAQSHELPADLVAELRATFTEVELAELILVVGQANLNNRVGNAAKQLLGDD